MVSTQPLESYEPTLVTGSPQTLDEEFEYALLERIGDFEIEQRLGAGAMGAVWRAVDPRLGRPVAIKLLRPQSHSRRARDRMLREARGLARVVHPHVVGIHEVGRIRMDEEGLDPIYIVLEYVEGQTLRQWQKQRPRPAWQTTLELFMGAARGLAAAHDAGLIHRDFKPENVLIEATTGKAKVADFGLVYVDDSAISTDTHSWNDEIAARAQQEHLQLHTLPLVHTRLGTVMGTPAYMAPEQLLGQPVSPACDQFAFCLCLWEALHGSPPWKASSLEELQVAASRRKLIVPKSGLRLPGWLLRALERGLSHDAKDRFPDMHALIGALERGPRRTRQWMMAGAFATSVSIAAGISAWATTEPPPEPQTPDRAACRASMVKLEAASDLAQALDLEQSFVASEGESARKTAARLSEFTHARIASFHGELEDLCTQAQQRPLSHTERLIHSCLEQRTAKLKVTLETLANPKAFTVAEALYSANINLDQGQCEGSQNLSLLPEDPQRRQRYIQLGTRTSKLWSQAILTDQVDRSNYDELRVLIEDFGDESLRGAFLYEEGFYWGLQRDLDKKEQAHREGFKASSIAGDTTVALKNLGGVLYALDHQGRFDETSWVVDMGDIQLARTEKAHPLAAADWLASRGSHHALRRDYARAAKDFDSARALASDFPSTYIDYIGPAGNAHLRAGNFDTAVQRFEELIELEPELRDPSLHTHFGFAVVYFERDMSRSLELTTRAYELMGPGLAFYEAGLHRTFVAIHLGAGDYRAAQLAIERGRAFFDTEPNLKTRQSVLEEDAAAVAIELGQFEDAERIIEQLEARAFSETIAIGDQGRSRLPLLRARLHLERGQLEQAERELQSVDWDPKFYARMSHHGSFELLSARLHHARGALDLAEGHLRAGLRIHAGQLTPNADRIRPELELLLAEVLWAKSSANDLARAEAHMWAESARDQLLTADPTQGRLELLQRARAWLAAH